MFVGTALSVRLFVCAGLSLFIIYGPYLYVVVCILYVYNLTISCNVKQGTSLVKNSSQTVEIKGKTNEKKPYLEQNISNHKLDGSDKKANTNTSPEMKISCNVKQGTSLVKNSSQTVKIKEKTNEKKPYLEQNISNHKLNLSDKKANTNTSPEMKISCNVKQGTSLVKNSSQTVEIKDKTNEKNAISRTKYI